MSIKEKLKGLQGIKKIFIDYAKSGFSEKYIENILNAMKHYENIGNSDINIMQLGNLNKDKMIGLIRFTPEWTYSSGFFAIIHRLLQALAVCERLNLYPVVDIWNKCAYQENIPVNGTSHVFEYYFEQPAEISLNEAKKSFSVVVLTDRNFNLVAQEYKVFGLYRTSDEYIDFLARTYKKYIKMNKIVEEEITRDIIEIIGTKKTLGVHVRGTDFKLNCNNHPKIILPEDYIEPIKEAIDKNKFEQIFLATDDMTVINLFEKEFKDIVVYYSDVCRAEGNISVAFSESERRNHHYLCGFEVLRDMYTLTSCSGLIAGASQVSVMSRVVKKSFGEKYDYLKILDKGINYNDKLWKEILKTQKKIKL